MKQWMMGLMLVLTACAHTPEPEAVITRPAPKRFEVEGKVGLRYPECPAYQECKEANYQLEWWWAHSPEGDELRLMDPLGKERARLHYRAGQIYWTENGQEQRLTPEQLQQQLGVQLPIDAFAELFTTYGTQTLWQNWRLKRRLWQENHYQKMTLEQGDYRITLAVTAWREK